MITGSQLVEAADYLVNRVHDFYNARVFNVSSRALDLSVPLHNGVQWLENANLSAHYATMKVFYVAAGVTAARLAIENFANGINTLDDLAAVGIPATVSFILTRGIFNLEDLETVTERKREISKH